MAAVMLVASSRAAVYIECVDVCGCVLYCVPVPVYYYATGTDHIPVFILRHKISNLCVPDVTA